MSNISKRRREGSRAKIKSMGDHKEFLKRITKTLYYGHLPTLPCLSLPVTEESCALWSAAQQGRSLRRLHLDAAARLARGACVSPCALVLALLYLERLRTRNPHYLAAAAPAHLFLVSLMVGNKFLQDDGEDDEVVSSEWAAAADLPPAELNQLEIQFLNAIEWNVFVSDECFESGLSRLERRVALRQARARGFFTYGDLAACAGAAELAAASAAALALASLATLAALLASALLSAALSPLHRTALTPATELLNATAELPPPALRLDAWPDQPRCCTDRLRYRATTETDEKWFDAVVEWKRFEGWWSWTPALGWVRADPVRRWLDSLHEYADSLRESDPPRGCPDGRCARHGLNISRLSALAASASRTDSTRIRLPSSLHYS